MFLPDPDAAFFKEQGRTKIHGEPNFAEHAMLKSNSRSDLRFSLVMMSGVDLRLGMKYSISIYSI